MRISIVAVMLCVAARAQAQSIAARVTSADDRALLTQLVEREDLRQLPAAADARHRGLASGNSYLRAFTVRGLGRLEKPEVLGLIVEKLSDASAEVRAAAADAVAQSVARGGDSVARARGVLLQHLTREADPAARAGVLEAIGRLPQGSVEQVKATANAIAPSLSAPSVIERRGAIRGIFFLARKREARAAGAIPTGVTDKMFAMLDEPASAGFTPTDRFNIAYALWGSVALNDQRSHRLFADHETMVRERGIVNFARSSDLPLVRAHLEKTLVDSSPIIRFRSIGLYSQKLRAIDGCAPIVRLSGDANVTVALGAIDAMSGCRGDQSATSRLRALAEGLRDDDRWHAPAHALVALASIDTAAARQLLPRFVRAKNLFVRMYADSVALLLHDAATLYSLVLDEHPNVQASAISGLSRLVGHAADSVYVRALTSEDNQVLMATGEALKGSTYPGLVTRVTELAQKRIDRKWETDLDGNKALMELSRSLGGSVSSTSDSRSSIPLPAFSDLAALETATARIEMADGAIITMKLHPFDAPTNAFRFARLARGGTFDGLTFHRVAPFFVVQGPSPNANEYSAPDKPFARDELGVSNVRGTVGLSTRGRDTGDGQIFINTVDNIWLDHDYTVMATITSGIEAFDRMQEGARIRRITITP
jgi:cyclophilin family peptidyl-prolyl cis-trans isomerase/HEAT repeat protein